MICEIRPMQQSDIARVYEIEQLSHRAPWSRDILSDCVLVGYDCRVLEVMMMSSKQIVGYIICRRNFNICHILNLCVAVAEQRKGYGEKLLEALLHSLANSDSDTVILEVRPSNKAALKLYKKFGFEEDIIKKGYYQDEHGEEDAILLKKIIPHSSSIPSRG
ncbi:ribosomal protein S18-alanine N-acetyltransferase [Legionella hackeliae]|uniref:GCN5-related N-acetyltransferase n=1 Tax=Legionella hackeliae TaxID=449 RepID=A0A0A8UTR0_LEGHA|nr:ribosomal protein S18-alanine N-acetyltransferase [Legionella hackeliae]KTD09746.1 GCN5-related N-acetyltransferase [Legionella hackeliae]CEK10926.1 GCN5-related N-acetyltransferase [Legionella hackeliae]STX47664.1 N-acetyltransferase GCN5 [Legionella hackeliae]